MLSNMKKPFVIGISGGSGSGKTSFVNQLKSNFNDSEVSILSQDNYYKSKDEQEKDEFGIENFDLPTSINTKLFISDLKKLLNFKSVIINEYTFNNENKKATIIDINPSPIIIIEGMFLFNFKEIEKLIDLKLFIDTSKKLKLSRRINRDEKERGYNIEDVKYRYEKHVTPSFKKYLKPYINDVDIIINNNKSFQNALDIVKVYIDYKLKF